MAVTKLLRIKEAKNRSLPSAHLQKNIAYICRDDKTEEGLWIGGNAGNTAEVIYRRMRENKEAWGKTSGSQGFHYVLSFPPEADVDAPLAAQIAEEFCDALLGGNFYYVYAVHTDTEHLHVHITFDSVSRTDGYKFHSPKGDWEKRIQPITDRLCKKYGLPSLSEDLAARGYDANDRKGADYRDHKRQRAKQVDRDTYFSWLDIMRDDIDEAVHRAGTYEEFLQILKDDHYLIRDKAALSLKLTEMNRAIRTGRLGAGYGKEDILFRIQNKTAEQENAYRYVTYGNWTEMQNILYLCIKRDPNWRMTPFQRQFYERWNNTFFIRRPDRRAQAWKYKKDIAEVRKLSAAFAYTVDHEIGSEEELNREWECVQTETKAVKLELARCRKRLHGGQLFYQLAMYEKLQKECEENPDPHKIADMESVRQQIESKCTLEEAVRRRKELQKHIEELKAVRTEQKKRERTLKDIAELLYGTGLRGEKAMEGHTAAHEEDIALPDISADDRKSNRSHADGRIP